MITYTIARWSHLIPTSCLLVTFMSAISLRTGSFQVVQASHMGNTSSSSDSDDEINVETKVGGIALSTTIQ